MSRRLRAYAPFIVITAIALGGAILTASPSELQADLQDLGSTNPATRKAAIDRLSQGSSHRKSQLLGELDGNHSALTKASIAEVVRKLGISSANAGVLKTCLESTDRAAQHAAISILAAAGRGDLALTALSNVAADKEAPAALRGGAAVALSTAGPQARSALKDLVAEAHAPTGVHRTALRALATCSQAGAQDVKAIVDDIKASQDERVAAIAALASKGSKGKSLLVPLARAPWPWMRQAVLDGLASTGQKAYRSAMVTALADAVAAVRLTGLRGLIATGGEQANRTAVRGLLNDADPRIQVLAAQSVGRTCADIAAQVRGALVAQLGSGNFTVRYGAAMALLAHGDKGGLATMQADQLSANASIAAQATYAANRIQAQ